MLKRQHLLKPSGCCLDGLTSSKCINTVIFSMPKKTTFKCEILWKSLSVAWQLVHTKHRYFSLNSLIGYSDAQINVSRLAGWRHCDYKSLHVWMHIFLGVSHVDCSGCQAPLLKPLLLLSVPSDSNSPFHLFILLPFQTSFRSKYSFAPSVSLTNTHTHTHTPILLS